MTKIKETNGVSQNENALKSTFQKCTVQTIVWGQGLALQETQRSREEPARTQFLFIPTKAFRLMWSFLSLFHFSSVAQSVMSHSLQPHGLQHTRLPCPSPFPRACSNSCPLSQWCHPIISSSVVPFSSCLQSFPDQDLFQWVGSSHQVAKVLELQLQHKTFQWTFRVVFL